LDALRRLAAICLSEVIWQSGQLIWFRHLERLRRCLVQVRIAQTESGGGSGSGIFAAALYGPVRKRMRLEPQSGGSGRIDAGSLPPGRFVATTMDLAMMAAAERYSELIAQLGKAQMMWI